MNQANNIRRNFYKWHRILGLTGLVPVICWTLSGLSHPFMSNWLRPSIPLEVYQQPNLTQLQPKLSLADVLDQNHITQLRNFGIISLNHQTYYQVLQKDSTYKYYSAGDGKQLSNADSAYAVSLARYFTQDSLSKIKSAVIQKSFDGAYQPINHILPVWKISFDRPDGMDIYIETGQSRMGTFNNHTRKTLLWVFEQMHTWDFLAAWFGDQFRLILMIVVVSILLLSMVSGLIVYGFFWKRFKEIADKRRTKGVKDTRWLHRYHRKLGFAVSFLMLMFFLSAGFHILVKLHNGNAMQKDYTQLINRSDIEADNLHLPIADSLIKKIALVKIADQTYYQVVDNKKNIHYYNTLNIQENPNGDKDFAEQVIAFYRFNEGLSPAKQHITANEQVRQFTNEYGFINKRLPVRKISFAGSDNWYVETTTGTLAAHVAGIDRAEGLSFIFLHKFFWMTWAGKDVRDIVSMLSALSILLVSLFGFAAFVKNK